jgi:probable phosphoglycerate mutase
MQVEKELYIIRHGQTDLNAQGIIQGKGVNMPLNDLGRRQAQAFYEAYKHIPFDIMYSSTLLRAQQTIEPFKPHNIPHEVFSELDEISWGDLEGSMTTHETDANFLELTAKWRNGELHVKPSPTGESPLDLHERQKRFINHLLTTPQKKILIATHGRFIRAFMCTLTATSLSEMENYKHANLCLYKVNLLNSGNFVIEKNNEQAHLQSI